VIFNSYVFTRGNALVELQVYTDPNPEWVLGFVWIGFRDQSREAEHLRLLNEVQQALFDECNLPPDQLKIVNECVRMECPK
jgi:hypothetical protein